MKSARPGLCTAALLFTLFSAPLTTALLSGCSGKQLDSSTIPPVTLVAPTITAQPASLTASVGDVATFSVTATGSAPLSYDWRRNGTSLAAANSSTYTSPALAATDDGALYTVAVTNTAGSVLSSPAKVSIKVRTAQITTAPADASIYTTQSATFTVVATGAGPLSYQWLRNGTAIAGATSASYTFSNAALSDTASSFSVAVTNPGGTVTSAAAKLTVAQGVIFTQTSGTAWTASNGLISATMDPTKGSISGLTTTINGASTNWLDPANGSPYGHAIGFYDLLVYANNGFPATKSVPSFSSTGAYVDMWVDKPTTPGGDPLDIENHWVIRAGDQGIHYYQVIRHGATDGATNLGAATVNFFPSANATTRADGTTLFYSKNTGPNDFGVHYDSFPTPQYTSTLTAANPGRQVQKETVDYTATTLGDHLTQPGLTREFITKYNYGTYQQFHVAHGFVGDTNAFWWVVPSTESFNGGPEKQVLSTIQLEYQSAHLGGTNIVYAANEVGSHIYGPYYLHFNAFDNVKKTNDDLYADAANTIPQDLDFYDSETTLTGNGYVKHPDRGSLVATINSPAWDATTQTKNVVVLTDNKKFLHESTGYQYWGYADATGHVTIPNVNPGTYRMTSYILGQWGLFHQDDVVIGNTPKTLTTTFQPRNFGTQPPIWTIGIPDRSAHEFLHGHTADGRDNKDYIDYNYWKDLEPNSGKVVYTVGTSNYATDWLFTQWNHFYPNLYAGVYPGGSTTGSNGYDYITPAYVIAGAAAKSTTPALFSPPAWEVHFKTTAAQVAQGNYVLVSINLAANDTSSLQVNLNARHSNSLLWYPRLRSDPEQRSGVSGYNNYAVFQFPVADLAPVGQDNVMTLFASGSCMYDALKLEISPTSGDPALSGWPEYDWLFYDASNARQSQAAVAP